MQNKRLKVAISPCPNDTFIFGAWINQQISVPEFMDLDIDYLDIQELNEQAVRNYYDVIKISAVQLQNVNHNYVISNNGGAAGFQCGPLLVSKKDLAVKDLIDCKIGLPGKNTTANFLFHFLFPEFLNLEHCVFSEIEDRILMGDYDAGVIIHESRFSYQLKGLKMIADLGELWHKKTAMPIPLGLIAIKRNLPDFIQNKIQVQILNSLTWATEHPSALMPFIRSKAANLEDDVIRQHIDLYVNEFTKDLGESGKSAVFMVNNKLIEKNSIVNPVFI